MANDDVVAQWKKRIRGRTYYYATIMCSRPHCMAATTRSSRRSHAAAAALARQAHNCKIVKSEE